MTKIFIYKKRRTGFWLVVLSSLIVLGLVAIATRPLHDEKPQPVSVAKKGPPQPMLNAVAPEAAASHLPTFKLNKSVTVLRAALWDTTDVMASVRAIRTGGTADEKGWAADLMRECYGYVDQTIPKVYDKPGQREAWAEIAKRCAGVRDVSKPERHAILEELYAGAELSMTQLHDLKKVYERVHRDGDNRWTNVEADSITAALHGDDPIVRREAFNLLTEAVDDKAPGGDARKEAMLFAMADQYLNQPLSEFERLQRCTMFDRCELPTDGPTGAANAPSEREGARLRAAYAEAFARRAPASAILAIR